MKVRSATYIVNALKYLHENKDMCSYNRKQCLYPVHEKDNIIVISMRNRKQWQNLNVYDDASLITLEKGAL